ncbi:MAG: DUF4282 domain-containing protein [Gammaproteobacteria bacterium]|nr:DUF4282 domain-containing protein [Gammaproteobacteria bacterium]
MIEYLTFRRMITPIIIQVLFWLGILGIIVAAFMSGSFLKGLLIIVIGPLVLRVYCEILIVLFKIHDAVEAIAERKSAG